MVNIKLKILDKIFSIHRLSPDVAVPPQVYDSELYSIIKTDNEISIVCDSSIQLQAEESVSGWSCLQIIGPLDFSLTGILSGISTVLANSKISIFAISTFNTDYILVETANINKAKQALIDSGYIFED